MDKEGPKGQQDGLSVSGRYDKLSALREPYLTRARKYAKLTIPALVPPANNNGTTRYSTPFQSVGAKGVNNLASKLVLAMMPPNAGFFQLSISDYDLEKMVGQPGARANVDSAFGKIERAVHMRIETKNVRLKLFEDIKHLIVAGNELMYIQDDGFPRFYPLPRYVVKRDPVGRVLEIITKEDMSPLALSVEIRDFLKIDVKEESPENTLSLYTRVYLEDDGQHYGVYQELNNLIVPGSYGTYALDELPWVPLRFIPVEGEDYGRSYIEEIYGDLNSLECLRKALLEGAAAAARILFLLKPNATTNKKKITEANNGALIEGNVDDIGILRLDKYSDFRTPLELSQELTKSLSFAFLLNSSVQRAGDRVTAEEIRFVAEELEATLGGIYSVLAQELQLSIVKIYMRQMAAKGEIPDLPKDLVAPKITTGLSALGRGFEMSKLEQLMQKLAPLGPEVISAYVNLSDYITRLSTGLAIDTAGLVRTQEEVQQAQQAQQQQAMQQQMMQSLGPNAVKGLADNINQQAQPQ